MQTVFFNYTFNKNKLKTLLMWYMVTYGQNSMIDLAENLKLLGFQHATYAGISLGIDDLRTVSSKYKFINKTYKNIKNIYKYYELGAITEIQKSEYLIENWQKISEILKMDINQKFKTTKNLNPIYMMAFSGARGNISQVRQLIGMRGLMADPSGQIIHLPITSNFREGLSIIEYLISCYGARKGVVDTALRTATAGYLTRRLVDTSQHVIISQLDCSTKKGVFLSNLYKNKTLLLSLKDQIYGRILGKSIHLKKHRKIFYRNQQIDQSSSIILENNLNNVYVRSSLRCQAPNLTLCQLCYGWNLSYSKLISLGEIVGIIAAQSIGEPGTQLTMRTFHTGGVFSGTVGSDFYAPFDGTISYSSTLKGNLINLYNNRTVFLVKEKGLIKITPTQDGLLKKNKNMYFDKFFKKERISSKKFEATPYTTIFVKHKETVNLHQLIAKKNLVLSNNQQIEAYYTINSKIEGEIVFEQSKNNKQKMISPLKPRVHLWILNGKIYKSILPLRSLFKRGDFISYKFPMARIKLLTISSSFLRVLFIRRNGKFCHNINNQRYQINLFTENPLYYIGLKNCISTNKYFLLESLLSNEIEVERVLRLKGLKEKRINILNPKNTFATKIRETYFRYEQRNLFLKSSSLNNYNEKVLNSYKSDKIKWFLPDLFTKNYCQLVNLKALRISNNLIQNKKEFHRIKKFRQQSKHSSYHYIFFNSMKKHCSLKTEFSHRKIRFINLFFKTSDSFKIINSQYFVSKLTMSPNSDNNILFCYPSTSLRYSANSYLLKYMNYSQEILNLSLNSLFRIRIKTKPIGVINYSRILMNKIPQNVYFQNDYTFLLIVSLFPLIFSYKSEKPIYLIIQDCLSSILKIPNSKSSLQSHQKIIISLLSFLQNFGFLFNITLHDQSKKLGKFIGNVLDSFSFSEKKKNLSLLILVENNKLENQIITNTIYFKQVVNIKYYDIFILASNSEKDYFFKLNSIFLPNPQFFHELRKKKRELKKLNLSVKPIFSQILNLNPLDGWVLSSYQLNTTYQRSVEIKNRKLVYFTDLCISTERLNLTYLIGEFKHFSTKSRFWNSSEKQFFSNYISLSCYKEIKKLNDSQILISRKMGRFFSILKKNWYSKKFSECQSFDTSFAFVQLPKINLSRILLKICIPNYFLLNSIKNSSLYTNLDYKNKFSNYNFNLSSNFRSFKFKELYYRNNYYSFYNHFLQLNSNLFNKQRLTKLNFSKFYKRVKLFFYITVPMLQHTYTYRTSYLTYFSLENKFFLSQSMKLINNLSQNCYYFLEQNKKSLNTQLKLPLLEMTNLLLYFKCSFITTFFQRNLKENEKYLYIKEKIFFSLTHLNWLARWSPIAYVSLLNPYEGRIQITKITRFSNRNNINSKLMILTNRDINKLSLFILRNQESLLKTKSQNKNYFINTSNCIEFYPSIDVGALLHTFTVIYQGKKLFNPGQVLSIIKKTLILRKGKPLFSSSSGIFYIWNRDLINKNSPIMTLLYNKLRTGDIVQGIPKIEQFFEARKSVKETSNLIRNNLLIKLLVIFIKFKKKLSLSRAVRRSLAKIQKIIIDGIIRVYCSQGITISRKHFEIIIRQMTSKVRIIDGGGTGLLEGEFINISKIERINSSSSSKRVLYEPVVLGITRTSLKTESFISSASFQETTRVLSSSALERRMDFLNGLKENIILSKLIPGGTGLITSLKIPRIHSLIKIDS